MYTTYEIPKAGLEITNTIDGVDLEYYQSMASHLDKLSGKTAEAGEEYRRRRFVISNYVYLINERIGRNEVRKIDYDKIRSWANKNKKLAVLLLRKEWGDEFPFEAFEKWISSDIDLLNCGMYRPSNRLTKNTYH